jgi:hypothetical protein
VGKRRVRGLKRVGGATPAKEAAPHDPSLYLEQDEQTGVSSFQGVAVDADILVAAASAYLSALNRLLSADDAKNAIVGAGEIGTGV